MSTGAARRLAIIAEASYGAGAGASPAFATMLCRSGGPKIETDTLEDDTIRGDYHRVGVRQGSRKGTFAIQDWLRYNAYDVWLEAMLGGTWTANVLKTGSTRRSFCIEEYYSDLDSGDKPYQRFTGCEFGKLSLAVTGNQLVTANFEGLCKDVTRASSAIANATYADPATNPAIAFKDASFTVDGSPIGIVTSLSLTFDRMLQPRFTANGVTTLQPDGRVYKTSGTLEVWLDTGAGALIDAYLAETQKALGLTFLDPAGDTLLVTVPALRFTSGMPNVGGDTSIPVSLSFEAYYDSVSESQLTITRTPHTP
jgi:hypothetical protein